MRRVYSIRLMMVIVGTVSVILGLFTPITAQEPKGRGVCVLVYLDENRNGTREPGETILPGVGLKFSDSNNVTLLNRISAADPVCVNTLTVGTQYTLTLDGPLYRAIDQSVFVFTAEADTDLTREFAAEPAPLDAQFSGPLEVPLNRPVRLALSISAAVIAMITFGGVGMVIYGLFIKPRSRRLNRRPPGQREPKVTDLPL